MRTVEYEIVDVFTDEPFGGNPLAVVFDAGALDTAAMQLLAREFNLSETTFVLPPEHSDASYRARIFTPNAEVPFAGHPSIGAAVTAVRRGVVAAAEDGAVVQECGAGLLPLTVDAAAATLTGGAPTVSAPQEVAPLLAAAGLTEDDLAGPPPRTAGCGLSFPYLLVRPEAVARATGDAAAAHRAGVTHLIVAAWDAQTRVAHVRMFAPGLGVPEDPATGSGALGLGVWLVTTGLLPGDGDSDYTVHQGAEVGRPSLLRCTVTARGGEAVAAMVTGAVAPVARGEITVPGSSRAPVPPADRPAA